MAYLKTFTILQETFQTLFGTNIKGRSLASPNYHPTSANESGIILMSTAPYPAAPSATASSTSAHAPAPMQLSQS